MSEVAKVIEACIRLGLSPALKADGYKKKGRTFYQAGINATRVVNVQSSQSNLGAAGKFTLNLGVYFPEVERVAGNDATLQCPVESQCSLRERIGLLLPERKDKWWEVGSGIEIETISDQVLLAWKNYGRIWMESHRDPESALTQADNGLLGPVRIAAIHMIHGRTHEAQEEIDREIRVSRNPSFRQWLLRWARSAGLVVSQPPGV